MANIIDIKADPRTASGTGAVNRLRKTGFIPAVVYGRGRDNVNVQVDGKSFTKIINHSASDNILVNLQIGESSQLALVQEVQHNYIKSTIIHVDFHAVNENEEIHAAVPVNLVGEPAGAKFGGLLELHMHSIQVHCLPKDLPEKISADVTHLNVGDALHVRELALPEGVRVQLEGSIIVAAVSEPKVEEVAPAAAAPAADAKAAAPAADAKAAAAPAKK
jgi:large subunit ribosomal protein L25